MPVWLIYVRLIYVHFIMITFYLGTRARGPYNPRRGVAQATPRYISYLIRRSNLRKQGRPARCFAVGLTALSNILPLRFCENEIGLPATGLHRRRVHCGRTVDERFC